MTETSARVVRLIGCAESTEAPAGADQAVDLVEAIAWRIQPIARQLNRSTAMTDVMDAVEHIVAGWPDGVRPDAGQIARTVAAAYQRREALARFEAEPKKQPAPRQDPPAAREAGQPRYLATVEAVKRMLEDRGLTPNAIAGWVNDSDQRVDQADDDLLIDIKDTMRRDGWQPVEQEVKDAFSIECRDRRLIRRTLIVGALAGEITAAGQAELVKWVTAVTAEQDPERLGLYVVIMQHWLWLVQRRIHGLRVDWDIMPVVVGPQGSGKTTAVEKLCAPWRDLVLPIDATALTDERKSIVLTRGAIGCWEEMARADSSSIEALKRTVTADVIGFRTLHTMNYNVHRRTMNFIGTSNISVESMIQDTTGNRRFVEIPCQFADRDAINAIDYTLIWRSGIDTNAPSPALPHLADIQRLQATQVHRDLIQLWLDSDDLTKAVTIQLADRREPMIIPAYRPSVGYSLEQLAGRIASWARSVGQVPPIMVRIRQRLTQLGARYVRVRLEDGSRPWRWLLPVSGADGPSGPTWTKAVGPPQVDGGQGNT